MEDHAEGGTEGVSEEEDQWVEEAAAGEVGAEEIAEYEDIEDEDDDEEVLLTDPVQSAGQGVDRARGGRGGGRPYGIVGDCSEDDERADRDQGLLQDACLPVSGGPLPPGDGPPKDADEYLRQVQWERLHCPEIVDVEVEERQAKGDQKRRRGVGGGLLAKLCASEEHEGDVPRHCAEWAEDAAAAFEELRERCELARRAAGRGGNPGRLTLAAWRERCGKDRPSTAVLARQDFVSINRLVVVGVDALVKLQEQLSMSAIVASAVADVPEIHAADMEQVACHQQGSAADEPGPVDSKRLDTVAEWLFAALAFVEQPLIDDVQFQLQRLRRTCQKLLVGTPGAEAVSGILPRADLLLVIATQVFGQR